MNWISSGLHHEAATGTNMNKKLKGVRRRKWGKWVSEIRVPGTQERLWLGTYATPEAAAVAHDVAVYYLRRPSTLDKLNFPETLSSYRVHQMQRDIMMSPRSVQKVASDVAMDVDARNIASMAETHHVSEIKTDDDHVHNGGGGGGSSSSVCNVGPAGDNSSGVFWWEGLGDDLNCAGTWQGANQVCRDEKALSISIEDYL